MKKDKKLAANPTPNPQAGLKPPGYWLARKAERKARLNPGVTPVTPGVTPTVTPTVTPAVAPTDAKTDPIEPLVMPPASRKQQALSITQEILKNLALMKKAFLRVVVLIGQVRDEKLYAELGYATLFEYADAQFGLKQSSLKVYIRVYDGLRANHPALLKPGAKIKLADLNDAETLIWIEEELARKSLPEADKTALQDLRKKALDGTLRRSEVRAYKAHGNKIAAGNRAFLSKLRRLRKDGAKLAGLPEGVIAHLESAIGILDSAVADAKMKAGKKGPKRPMAPK